MSARRVPAPEAVPQGVAFEVERFEWRDDGKLELTGRWYGLRGHRFVRPALTVDAGDDRRRMLADLEHKPWAAEDGEEWIAAFPWEGEPMELAAAELAVAPSLAVELPPPRPPNRRRKAGPPPTPGPRPARRPPEPRPATTAKSKPPPRAKKPVKPPPDANAATRRLEAELATARATISAITAELDEARAQRAAQAHDTVASERAEALDVVAAAERQRDQALDSLAAAERERDAAVAQRDAAVAQRDAAVDARSALVREREEAVAEPDPSAAAVRRPAISREAMRHESALVLWTQRLAAVVVLVGLAVVVYVLVHGAV